MNFKFDLTKTNLLYALLGSKLFIEIIITLNIIMRAKAGVLIYRLGNWFSGENLFIAFVNLIIMACVLIILGQLLLKKVAPEFESLVNKSTIADLSLLGFAFVVGIIKLISTHMELYYAFIKILKVSLGASVVFVILAGIVLLVYKFLGERLES